MKRILKKSFVCTAIAVLLVLNLGSCRDRVYTEESTDGEFKSVAYVALGMLKLHTLEPNQIEAVLDHYRWEGISDIVLIGGVFQTGKNGTIITSWNRPDWPEVYEGLDYFGKPIDEERHRSMLLSRESLEEVIRYFKSRGMDLWLSQTAAGWLTGGSFGIILENPELRETYATKLVDFAKEMGCIGIDFDYEFPPTEIEAEGYRELMKTVKNTGMKVSVCAILPTVGEGSIDAPIPGIDLAGHAGKYMQWEKIIEEEMVDYIYVMQYLGYNPETKQFDVDVKYDKMATWEKVFPNEFTENRKVKFLAGIGFYSFLPPEYREPGDLKRTTGRSIQFLYDTYGGSALEDKVIDGHAVWSTEDVKDIVRHAKNQGWTGVFTWLVQHDVTKEVPDKYSRQKALAEEVENIWHLSTEHP